MAAADYPRSVAPASPDSPPADPATALLSGLRRLNARRNTQLMIRALMRTGMWGLLIAAAGVFAYRLYLVDGPPWVPAVPIALALAIGAGLAWRARRGVFQAALDADRSLGLKEHLSSALAFAHPELVTRAPGIVTPRHPARAASGRISSRAQAPKPLKTRLKLAIAALPQRFARSRRAKPTPPVPVASVAATAWVSSLVRDAASKTRTLDPKRVYPWKWRRSDIFLLVAVAAFAGVALMPNLEWLRTVQQRREAQALQQPGVELQQLARRIQANQQLPNHSEARNLARRLEALGQRMARGRMQRRDALVAMSQLRRDLQRGGQPQNQQQAANDFSRAEQNLREQSMQSPEGQQMQQALQQGDLERAAQQLDRLAQRLEQGNMSQAEREKAANDLERTAQALRRQGGDANERAARQLEQAAQQLRQSQQSQQSQQGRSGQSQSQQGGGQQNQRQQGGNRQGQQGGGQSQQGQQSGQQGQQGAGALRQLAQGLRGSQMGNSQAMRDMLNQIRRAEQQSGQGTGQQAGQGQQPGQGQGQSGQGQGQGQGQQSGNPQASDPHGQVGGGGGLGRRDHAQGVQAGGGISQAHSHPTGDRRRWSDVWSDRLPRTHRRIDRITGRLGTEGDVDQTPTQSESQGGSVNTPYYNVYESYRREAEDAVSREQVPPAYRQPVKNYFESLRP